MACKVSLTVPNCTVTHFIDCGGYYAYGWGKGLIRQRGGIIQRQGRTVERVLSVEVDIYTALAPRALKVLVMLV